MSKSYVVESAKLQCSYGSQASSLKVPLNHRATINDKRQANIKDHKPNRNIQSFGLCSSLANPEVAAAIRAEQLEYVDLSEKQRRELKIVVTAEDDVEGC